MRLRARLSLAWTALTHRQPEVTDPLVAGLLPADGHTVDRGVPEALRAYQYSPWLRAVTAKISYAVGTTPWFLTAGTSGQRIVRDDGLKWAGPDTRRRERSARRKAGELLVIEEHPLLDALHQGNPYFGGMQTRELTQVSLDLVGEAFWLKERNLAGATDRLWLIPPTWVTRTPTVTNPTFELQQGRMRADVPAEDMVWFYCPKPGEPYRRGTGTAMALGDELETDEYASKHVKSFFQNRARPDLLITAKGMERGEVRRLENEWNHKLRTYWRQHKAFFLNRDVNVKDLSRSFADMQMVTLRQFERDTVLQVYGMPPELLGIIENSNRATIESADYLFARWVVQPRLEFMRERLQHLADEYDDRLVVDYESPVREDQETLLAWAKAAPWSRSVDQWRDAQGLDALDAGGEKHPVPIGVRLVDVGAATEPRKGEDSDYPEEMAVAAIAGAREIPAAILTPVLPFHACGEGDACHGEIAREPVIKSLTGEQVMMLMEQIEPELAEEIIGALEAMQGDVDISALVAALVDGDMGLAEELLLGENMSGAMYKVWEMLQEAFVQAGAAMAEILGEYLEVRLEFDVANPDAIAYLSVHGAQLLDKLDETTKTAVHDALVEAFEDGIPAMEIAEKIAKALANELGLTAPQRRALANYRKKLEKEGLTAEEIDAKATEYLNALLLRRAETIAVNELNMAGNKGLESLWGQAVRDGLLDPQTTEREWIISSTACERCQPMAGKKVGLKEPWIMWDTKEPVMTPTEAHVICRCTQGLVFQD